MATFRAGLQILSLTVRRCHMPACSPALVLSSSRLLPASALTILRPQNNSRSSLLHTTANTASYRNTIFEDKARTKIGNVNVVAPNFLKYNEVVYPPTEPGEPERPAEVCNSRFQIKYSRKKLWYTAVMVRGMSIDEAIKQLSFHRRKGAAHIKEVLEEAQEMAVRDHNVEFKSNLWIADSFVVKGITVKGIRKHARARQGIIHYRYCNYFVRLREGKPPEHYYPPEKTGNDLMADYIRKHREKRVVFGL
ncbi:hypothetical protein BsWGS_27270 [Bradybaena similaris]